MSGYVKPHTLEGWEHQCRLQTEQIIELERARRLAEDGWKRECDDVDKLLRLLGLDPEQCRSLGGLLIPGRAANLLRERGLPVESSAGGDSAARQACNFDASYGEGFRTARKAASKIVADYTDGDSKFDSTIAHMVDAIDRLQPESLGPAVARHYLDFFTKYGMPPLARPSCLVCGKPPEQWPPAIQHMDLPGTVVCHPCREATRTADDYKAKYENLRAVLNALVDDYLNAKKEARVTQWRNAAIGVIEYWAFKREVECESPKRESE